MKAKKFISIIVSMLLLATVLAVPAVADAGYAITPSGDALAKYGTTYNLTIKVTTPENVASAGCFVVYDTEIFTPVTAEITGCKALNANMVETVTVNTKTALKINSTSDNVTYAGTEVWATIPFTVKADGTETVDTTFELVYSADDADLNGKITWLKEGDYSEVAYTDINFGTLPVKAVPVHTAPSITGVAVSVPAEKTLGGIDIEMTAATEGWSDNWGLKEASTFEWKIGDKVVSTTEKYTPEEADLGKDVVVTATPTVEEEGAEAPFTGEPKSATVKVVPAADYVPTATVAIDKITAKKAVEADVEITMYKGMTDKTTYAWYKVAGVGSEEKAIEAVKAVEPIKDVTVTLIEKETSATASAEAFVKEDKGNYGVIKVTPVATYNETDYTGEAVYYAAVIKVAGGPAVQGGSSLATKPSTPVTPEDPEKPGTEDPEKPGTEEPGTEEPAGSEDPAGTAHENGAAAFTDVNKEAYAWAYDSIDVLAKAGVIKGMSETTFGPELTTTNAQVIALAVRIAGLTAEEGATTDKVDAEHWVAGEMAIADANEILGVYGDKVDVEGETTREIAFTLLYNALKAAGVELAETAEAIEFTDAASISEGCAEAIDALVKAGIVNGMGDGTLAPKATLTRAQLAKILGLANALIK